MAPARRGRRPRAVRKKPTTIFHLPNELQFAIFKQTDFYSRQNLRLTSNAFKKKIDKVNELHKIPMVKIIYRNIDSCKYMELFYDESRQHNKLFFYLDEPQSVEIVCKRYDVSPETGKLVSKTAWKRQVVGDIDDVMKNYAQQYLSKYQHFLKKFEIFFEGETKNFPDIRSLTNLSHITIESPFSFSEILTSVNVTQLRQATWLEVWLDDIPMLELVQIPFIIMTVEEATFTIDDIQLFVEYWRQGRLHSFEKFNICFHRLFIFGDLKRRFADYTSSGSHLIKIGSFVNPLKYLRIGYPYKSKILRFDELFHRKV